MSVGLYWLIFAFLASIIVLTGYRLTIFGDVIGDRSPLGHSWVGTILLASVTSLPEFITAITVASLGKADIIIGNVFGSNTFNMLIIFIVDLILIKSLFITANRSHYRSGMLGLGLSFIFLFSFGFQFLIGRENLSGYAGFPLGIDSFVVLFGYFFAMYYLFKTQTKEKVEIKSLPVKKYSDLPNKALYTRFAFLALIIVIAGVFMGIIGSKLADAPISIFGLNIVLGGTLMGTIFFAIITSLPELSVTISAVKIGSPDMALGNVFGSNLFNLGIIAVAEIAFTKGPILLHTNYNQVCTVVLSMLLITVAAIGVRSKTSRLFFKRVSLPSIIIFILYLVGMIVLWKLNLAVI